MPIDPYTNRKCDNCQNGWQWECKLHSKNGKTALKVVVRTPDWTPLTAYEVVGRRGPLPCNACGGPAQGQDA